MTEHLECCYCGAIFQGQTMVCPLCDSADLVEAVFDVRDCVRLLKAAFPDCHVAVETIARSGRTVSPALCLRLWLNDRKYRDFCTTYPQERLGSVFRRTLAHLQAIHGKPTPEAAAS